MGLGPLTTWVNILMRISGGRARSGDDGGGGVCEYLVLDVSKKRRRGLGEADNAPGRRLGSLTGSLCSRASLSSFLRAFCLLLVARGLRLQHTPEHPRSILQAMAQSFEQRILRFLIGKFLFGLLRKAVGSMSLCHVPL
jgi:uncharacterized protein YjeT (DUF2065 family)